MFSSLSYSWCESYIVAGECMDLKGTHISLCWLKEIFENHNTIALNLESIVGREAERNDHKLIAYVLTFFIL